jgi:hypothetical protein
MTRHLPGIPALCCVGCGGKRFVPLTFPPFLEEGLSDPVVRPNAKCVTCGLCHFGRLIDPII